MKIYICDDSKGDLLRLRHYLDKYAKEQEISMEVEEFLSAGDMLHAHKKAEEKPVLIFLDIYMNQIDGMETAKMLRKAGVKTSILFTTSSQEHAMEAFQVHADGYLHKPFDYEAFKHAMSKVSDQLQTEFRTIDIRIDRMNRKFRVKDICYAETDNHRVLIHCTDNAYYASITMEALKEQLKEEPSFIMCGRSFLVNLAYADSIDGEQIYMREGSAIPIPVRLRKQIREQYQQYQLDNRRD